MNKKCFTTLARTALMATSLIGIAGCQGKVDSSWAGYVEGEYIYVSSPLGGKIERVVVEAGQQVALNAPLFSLDKESEEAGKDEANARALAAKALAANTGKGRRQEEIAVTKAQLSSAIEQAKLAEIEWKRQQQLVAKGFISKAKSDDAETALKLAQARVAELSAALQVAQLPARSDERDAANANVIAAEQAIRQSTWRINQKSIVAPEAGLVSDVFFRTGEIVGAGQAVLAILPPNRVKLRFFVPEAEIARLQPGHAVSISCDGCQGNISAHITRISSQVEYTPPVIYSNSQRAKLVFMVEAKTDQTSATLHPGQPIDVRLLSVEKSAQQSSRVSTIKPTKTMTLANEGTS